MNRLYNIPLTTALFPLLPDVFLSIVIFKSRNNCHIQYHPSIQTRALLLVSDTLEWGLYISKWWMCGTLTGVNLHDPFTKENSQQNKSQIHSIKNVWKYFFSYRVTQISFSN